MHVYVLEMTVLSSCTAKNDPSTADRAPGDDAQEYSILQKKEGRYKNYKPVLMMMRAGTAFHVNFPLSHLMIKLRSKEE